MGILFNKAITKNQSDNPEKPQKGIYDKLRRVLNNRAVFNFWAILAYVFVILTIYYAQKLETNSADIAFGFTFFASLLFSIGLSRHGPGYKKNYRAYIRYLTIGVFLPLFLLPAFVLLDIQQKSSEGYKIEEVMLDPNILISTLAAIVFFSTIHYIVIEDILKIKRNHVDNETITKNFLIQIVILGANPWIIFSMLLAFDYTSLGFISILFLMLLIGFTQFHSKLEELSISRRSFVFLHLIHLIPTFFTTLLMILLLGNQNEYMVYQHKDEAVAYIWPLFAGSYIVFLSLSPKLWLNISLRIVVFFSFWFSLVILQGLVQAN